MQNKIRLALTRINPTFFICMIAFIVTIMIYFWSSLAANPSGSALEIQSANIRVTNLQSGEASEWEKTNFPIPAKHYWSRDPEQYEISFGFDARQLDSKKLYFYAPQFSHGGSIYLNDQLLETTASPETESHIRYRAFPFAADLNTGYLKSGHNEIVIKTISQDAITAVASSVWIGSIESIQKAFFGHLEATHTLKSISVVLLVIIIIFSLTILIAEYKNQANSTKLDGAKKISFIALGILFYIECFFPKSFPSGLLWLLTILQFTSITALIAAIFYGWMMLAQVAVTPKMPWLFFIPSTLSLIVAIISPSLKLSALTFLSIYLFSLYLMPALVILKKLLKIQSLKEFWDFGGILLLYVTLLPVVIHDFLVITANIFPIYPTLINALGVSEFWASSALRMGYVAPPLITAFMSYVLIEMINYGNLQRFQNDILEKRVKEREIELKTSYEQIKSQEVHIAQLNERGRIMRDLHDILGSILTIGALKSRSSGFSISQAGELFQQALDELRLMLNGFSGETIFLDTALSTLVEQMKRSVHGKILLDFSISGKVHDLGYDKSMNIVRIIQESLTNIVKYAHATKVDIVLKNMGSSSLIIEVSDDGIPFDYEAKLTSRSGRGLTNVLNRCNEINGAINYARKGPLNLMTLTIQI